MPPRAAPFKLTTRTASSMLAAFNTVQPQPASNVSMPSSTACSLSTHNTTNPDSAESPAAGAT